MQSSMRPRLGPDPLEIIRYTVLVTAADNYLIDLGHLINSIKFA